MEFQEPSETFKEFVEAHAGEDAAMLSLKYHNKDLDFNLEQALTQIACRTKCAHKLYEFVSNREVLFPSVVSAEQSTNEGVAKFHAEIIGKSSDVLDMTAGLGIDAMAIAKVSDFVTACEIDSYKATVLEYNTKVRNIHNLNIINKDSVEYLKNHEASFEVIFVDPARRGTDNKRVYNFHDCLPDILSNMHLLLEKGKKIFIKASPLLDVSQTLKDIPHVLSIRAISVDGECKEILIEASKEFSNGKITAEALDLNLKGEIISKFSYQIQNQHESDQQKNSPSIVESSTTQEFASVAEVLSGAYLYEPNATMMKLAPWKHLFTQFPTLKKMAPSSHLFVSQSYLPNFPGRVTKISAIVNKPNRKKLKDTRVNIVTRNYPLSTEQLKKELQTKEGKDIFLYATRIGNKPILILSERANQK